MWGSITMDDEAVPIELRGTVSTNNEVGTSRMTDPVSAGEGGVVKKRTRRSKPVGSEGAARKRRASLSADNEAGTEMMKDPVSGEERVVKKRTRGSKPVGSEGATRKKTRGAASGDEGVVKKRRMGPVATENHDSVTKRRRAPSRRKSAENNLTTDGVANACRDLGLPSAPSEERVDAGNMDKGRRKSTPRPKQINMSEGDADKHSPSTRLANCLSFARMKGIGRNKR